MLLVPFYVSKNRGVRECCVANTGHLIPGWRHVFFFFVQHSGLDDAKRRDFVANRLFRELFAIINKSQKYVDKGFCCF
jgi:hypothetical protein